MKRTDESPEPDDGAVEAGTHRRSGSRELGSPEPSLWDSDGDAHLPPRANSLTDGRPIEDGPTAPSRRVAPDPSAGNAGEPTGESSRSTLSEPAPASVRPAPASGAMRQAARSNTPPPPSAPARASGIPMPVGLLGKGRANRTGSTPAPSAAGPQTNDGSPASSVAPSKLAASSTPAPAATSSAPSGDAVLPPRRAAADATARPGAEAASTAGASSVAADAGAATPDDPVSRAVSRRVRRNNAVASVSPIAAASTSGTGDGSSKGRVLRRARINSSPPANGATSASPTAPAAVAGPPHTASQATASGSALRRARINSSPPPSLAPSAIPSAGPSASADADTTRAAGTSAGGPSPPSSLGGAPASATPEARAPGPAPVRVVAKIIDPSVRDDGRGDPQFSLEPQRDRVNRQPRVVGVPHPVRERLLARARAALDVVADADPSARPRTGAPAADDEWFPHGSAPRAEDRDTLEAAPDVADDLDLIGAPERPRPERTPHVAPALPAPTALLLGTLAGLVAIGLLFAGLMRFEPHRALRTHEPPVVVEAPEPVPDAPAPEPVGKVQRPPRTKVPGPWRIATAPPDARLELKQGSMGSHTFLAATQAAGVALKEAYRVLTAFEGIKNLDRCRPKDTFSALVDAQSGRLSAFEYTVNEEEVFQAREGADGKLAARKLDLDVKRHRAQGVVVLDGNFEASAQRAGFEPGLDTFVNKALSGYASTSDFRPGDVLGLVVQEVTVLGGFARYAGVEALEYRPVNGEPLRIYYQELDKSRGYVDSKGRVFGKSRWTRPVPGAGVTSRFNPKRMHPILKRIKPHNGTDFGAPIGTPVVAAAAGKVSFVGRAGPNGNMITIAHDGGFQTGYSHLSRFMKGLKVGARVEQKQPIGFVGSTGRSTGPHLHFSAKKNGRFIDPESLNLDGLLRLTVDQRLSSDLRRRYDRMLDALNLPTPQAPVLARTEPPPTPVDPLEEEIAAASAAAPAPIAPASPAPVAAPAVSVAAASTPSPRAAASTAPTPPAARAAPSSLPSSTAAVPSRARASTAGSMPTSSGDGTRIDRATPAATLPSRSPATNASH
jgi:murein DD-endopeptidase MepM/ murein hydrolase activator NlpD